MALDFRLVIGNLLKIGFYDVILPFFLVYVVIFAILEKSKIFLSTDGSDKHQVKNVNAVIAFVFGLFVVASIQTVKYIQSLILNIVLFVIFILVVLILFGFIFGEDYNKLFRNEKGEVKGVVTWSIAGIVFLVALYLFFKVTGIWADIVSWWNSGFSSDIGSYLVIILIGAALYFITKGDSKNSSSNNENK